MRTVRPETVRRSVATRGDTKPLERLPRRTTKQMHDGLLRVLRDRRFRRVLS